MPKTSHGKLDVKCTINNNIFCMEYQLKWQKTLWRTKNIAVYAIVYFWEMWIICPSKEWHSLRQSYNWRYWTEGFRHMEFILRNVGYRLFQLWKQKRSWLILDFYNRLFIDIGTKTVQGFIRTFGIRRCVVFINQLLNKGYLHSINNQEQFSPILNFSKYFFSRLYYC